MTCWNKILIHLVQFRMIKKSKNLHTNYQNGNFKPWILCKVYTINRKIDKKYFKDFNLKLDNIVVSLINLFIDINSPKTKTALETCKVNPEEVIIR